MEDILESSNNKKWGELAKGKEERDIKVEVAEQVKKVGKTRENLEEEKYGWNNEGKGIMVKVSGKCEEKRKGAEKK